MISQSSRKSFGTLAILAGSPSADVQGAQIMKKLKQDSREPVNFVGLGGDKMVAQGLSKNYGDLSQFMDKPFYPYKNFHRHYIEVPLHPLMAPLHYQEYRMRHQLKNNGFFRELADTQPEAFLVLGNEFFMEKLFKNIAAEYQDRNEVKPPCFMLDKTVINQENSFKEYVDHYLYSLPMEPVNWQYFKFPSTFVGKQGAYEALRWLTSSQKQSVFLAKEYHMETAEEKVQQVRRAFREEKQVSEEQTLVFVGAGNTKAEILFSVELALNSVKELSKRPVLNNQPMSNFRCVVSVEKDLAWVVEDMLAEREEEVVMVTTPHDKWEAMCGSDMGLAISGDIVNECAALHLQTVCLNYESAAQSYFTSLYGQWNNDVNIVGNGEVFPEKWTGKGGDAFPENIADTFCKWVLDPRLRFQALQRLESIVPSLLPKGGQEVNVENTSQLISRSTLQMQECVQPDQVLSDKLLRAMHFYKEHREVEDRQGLLETLGHRVLTN